MHSDAEVDVETGKPVMILDYNRTKAAVDRVDQLCHNYSVQKRTKRWPLAYFYNCKNLAGINAQVLFLAKFPDWNKQKSHRRRLFLDSLGTQLLQPWLQRRAKIQQLPKVSKQALTACGHKPVTENQVAAQGPRKRNVSK